MTSTPTRLAPPSGREELLAALRELGPDPFPDVSGERGTTHDWVYAEADRELGILARIVSEGRRVGRHVDYSENFGRPAERVRFRRTSRDGTAGDVSLIATGAVRVDSGGTAEPAPDTGAGLRTVVLHPASAVLEFTLTSEDGEPCAVAEASGTGAVWAFLSRDGEWQAVAPRAGGTTPPHRIEEPTQRRQMVPTEADVWTLAEPVLGRPLIAAPERPTVVPGESLAEAMADERLTEVVPEVVAVAPGLWTTVLPLAISHLRITGTRASEVAVDALVRDVPRRGAFVSSDDTLNRIWSTSAYTMRLCMQGLVVDGIKRDRMPWIGDQALGITANAFAFGDKAIVQDGLAALGRVVDGFVNGIADYSLWWVIAHRAHLQYFGDREFTRREADVLHDFVSALAQHADASGLFRPASGSDAFVGAGPGSVFIDWGYPSDHDGVPTALQMLWHWALESASEVLGAVDHPGAAVWWELAARLRQTLGSAWDGDARRWRPTIGTTVVADDGGYADFLAQLAGVRPPDGRTAESLQHVDARTPFMRAFAIQALADAGERRSALDRIRSDWAPLLELGAKTFWEDFPEPGRSPWEMYGRPFGKSLCHAWSSGPAALLPQIVLGIRPTGYGWSEFVVEPDLGDLDWAAVTVPTARGHIGVTATRDELTVDVPAGTTWVRGKERHEGPVVVSYPLPRL